MGLKKEKLPIGHDSGVISTPERTPEQKNGAQTGLREDSGVNTVAKATGDTCLETSDPGEIYFERYFKQCVNEGLTALMLDFSRQLFQEYDCKTVSEKVLAQVAANAYVRVLESSKAIDQGVHGRYFGGNMAHYYSMASRELDRASRQFIFALATLRQLKSPMPDIKVIAKNAFVAEKQQFNKN